MAGENLTQFPRGQVAINGQGSFQCTDATWKHSNGTKLKHTLRKNPAGWVAGVRAVTGSMNFIIDDEGDEFDFKSAVTYSIPVKLTVKRPGGIVDMLTVVFTEEGTDITLEDGVKKPISFTGYYSN